MRGKTFRWYDVLPPLRTCNLRRASGSVLCDRAGTSAIEFAIIAPVFISLLLTFFGYGFYLTTSNSLQQMAADAARTAVAGLSPAERSQLASDYINRSTLDYPMFDRAKLAVKVSDDAANPDQFTVELVYDASGLPIWNLYSFALPDKNIRRFATIRLGGI
jgi:Flp pilus assembly protein TadG